MDAQDRDRRGPRTSDAGPAPTGPSDIPRQRHRRNGVVVVVVSADPQVRTVLAGAKAATDRAEPLDLVMFSDRGRSLRSCMVAVDHALTVARTAFPLLEVRVNLGLTDSPGWESELSGQVSEVVLGPDVASRWADRFTGLPLTVVEEPGGAAASPGGA
jgi:hypothetical protein